MQRHGNRPAVMESRLALAVLIGSSVAASGCAPVQPHTVLDDATAMEKKRCGPDVDETALAPILSGEAIERVEPAYIAAAASGGHGAGGAYKRLAGAVFSVRALRAFSAEWLDRSLECHSARRLLGRIPAGENPTDPFWLPGKAVDIDVQSSGPEFAVSVRSLEVADAQAILARAQSFFETTRPR
jgi:hypothetical protein